MEEVEGRCVRGERLEIEEEQRRMEMKINDGGRVSD
jgi:hypothetical protein